ncbi:putative zinc finger protein 286B isoform X2 [Homarus americanus]|uniref:putative zinc finger protein 286B isoform X2 n=1 Tax=Homarus americanus TaxID=6706 RepID=UPI001C47535A|nr:putative zinc finger protein 286B isoform X2 [Homarus americanus]
MTSSYISDSCFVCQRGLVKGQGVKGSTSLPHSGTLVFEAIGEIVEEETAFSELCFRCYRLILRIDYHKRELKLLRKTFFELYNERGNLQSNIQNIVESRVIVCNVGNDNFMQSPACSESADSGDHVYYKNIFDNQLENLNFNETKFEVHCSSAERNIQNSSMHKSEEQELRNVTSEEKCDNECYIRDIAHDIVTEKVIKDVTVDGQDKLPSKRRKKAKKNEDYDYYTEDGSGLDSGWPNHIGNYSSEFKTCKSTYCKVKVNCNLCKRNFITKKEYIGHECFKKKKKGNISYVCKGCQSIFTLRRDYIKHIDFCYKNVPVNCQICLVKLSSAAYLPRHMKSFHEGVAVTKKGCLCDQCGRSFSRKESLERHQARVHGLSHGTHQCPQCGCTFPHTSLLAEHLRAHKGYTCTECNKTFSCMSNLTLHKRVHHQKKALYHCSSCNKSWRFHASYTYHMRKAHGLGQHKCSKCKLLFSAENALERHKENCVTDWKEQTSTGQSNTTSNDECGRMPYPAGNYLCYPMDRHPWLRFSPTKTVVSTFPDSGDLYDLDLYMYGRRLPVVQQTCFLGMFLDHRLTKIPQLRELKTACLRWMSLIRRLSHVSWSADQTLLL